jgi:hypothetical protein
LAVVVTLVVVVVGTAAVVVVDDTPTQYASSSQKPDVQSEETAGFQVRNWATVMPNSLATVSQVSPSAYISSVPYERLRIGEGSGKGEGWLSIPTGT